MMRTEVADIEALRGRVALACRILSRQGIMREVTGHVSARIPGTDEIMIRCRSKGGDPGVARTAPSDVRRTDLDGSGSDVDGYWLPGEFSLHAEIYKSRPDVSAIVHGHPRCSLLCGILGLELRPLFGGYDPVAMMLTLGQIAVFPRSILISSPELGKELVATMAGRAACLLAGHGIVAVGLSIEEATVTAIKIETIAEVTVQVAQAGGPAREIAIEDQQTLSPMTRQHGQDMPVNQWTFDLYAHELAKDSNGGSSEAGFPRRGGGAVATVAGGVATSHSPQVSLSGGQWPPYGEQEVASGRLDRVPYRTSRHDDLSVELASAVVEERANRCQKAIVVLAAEIAAQAPDVLVVVGDDQKELYLEDGIPAFALFTGDEIWDLPPGPDAYPRE